MTRDAGPLDAPGPMADNFAVDIEQLRASRRRLVLAADEDRRRIERDLHQGVQQHLVALAVNLQLLDGLIDADPGAAQRLVAEMSGDVQQALDATARLAQRVYPPLLEERGLGAALRAAAVTAGSPASVDVAAVGVYPLEVARTVYLCCLEAFEHAGRKPRVVVRDEHEALAFEVSYDGERELTGLRERVEALGGRMTIRSEPDGRTHVSGSIPVDR